FCDQRPRFVQLGQYAVFFTDLYICPCFPVHLNKITFDSFRLKDVCDNPSAVPSQKSGSNSFSAQFSDSPGNIDAFSPGVILHSSDPIQTSTDQGINFKSSVNSRVHRNCNNHFLFLL